MWCCMVCFWCVFSLCVFVCVVFLLNRGLCLLFVIYGVALRELLFMCLCCFVCACVGLCEFCTCFVC